MVISQKKAVKKKLMAATSMLLIACIMLISASYAWFTLSTAPEVKGITTTVGANGNLEIALATPETWAKKATVASGTGTSSETTTVDNANITWGNLVDVSDNAIYGMDKVVMMPSELNISGDATNGYSIGTSPLKTPNYGADGRVTETVANTLSGTYDKVAQKFPTSYTYAPTGGTGELLEPRGMRAIGAALDMTARQISYRNAKGTIATEQSSAILNARRSLLDNGSALGNIIIKYATNSSAATYTQDDVGILQNVVTSLGNASTDIQDALKATILGLAASQKFEKSETNENGFDAETFTLIEAALNSDSYTVSGNTITIIDTNSQTHTVDMGAEVGQLFAEAKAIEDNLTKAQAEVTSLVNGGSSAISWTEFKKPLDFIINTSAVTVNGMTTEQVKADMNAFLNSYTNMKGIFVAMPSGSGVYADIAEFCGDYRAGITLTNVEYGSLKLDSVDATMMTQIDTTAVPTPYFEVAKALVTKAGAPQGAGTGIPALTDFYGYAVDLFVRTNAAGSNLLLQQDAVQRIYDDSATETTMGGGSYMSYASGDPEGFGNDKVVALMDAVRLVITDQSGKVLSFAKLDTSKLTTADGKAIKLLDFTVTENGVSTTVQKYGTEEVTGDTTLKEEVPAGAEIKAPIALCDKDGVLRTGTDKDVITGLPTNTEVGISVLVYLDGENVTNAMVASSGTSMIGKMNLQFASSAELVPMDNTTLRGDTTTNNGTSTANIDVQDPGQSTDPENP